MSEAGSCVCRADSERQWDTQDAKVGAERSRRRTSSGRTRHRARSLLPGVNAPSMSCPFCNLRAPRLSWASDLVVAVRDQFPVSTGHTLVIPRRHVPTYFDASAEEQAEIWRAVREIKARLDDELSPDGYNVGFNAGEAAGQTVMHLHVHVIPRFRGDMDDPRGGVRHVIPSRGNYKREVQSLITGGENDPFIRSIRPLFDAADRIAIVAAFMQHSGLERLRPDVEGALERGAQLRFLTGDYLNITQVAALEELLDWVELSRAEGEDLVAGTLEARVVEVDRLDGRTRAFHPKSWRFEGARFGVVFVGSSNISHSALMTGIEWNLRIDRDSDAAGYERSVSAFQALWERARPLDASWIADYAKRARAASTRLPSGEAEAEELPAPFSPHEIQRDALAQLSLARADGRTRALAVLATGLGKTWLAAFDVAALSDDLGRPPRVLFLAHRREILRQSALTFRILARDRWPDARIGWFVGASDELDGDFVFASVMKLCRREHLEKIEPRAFDYVVVDEVHHAAASSYRRILDRLDPLFMLGLTATPDRADAADVAGLFDDFIAYRADIGEGVQRGKLVPFHYFGLKDDVDYASIPWKNRRFDASELAERVQTQRRMDRLWEAWNAHPADRTLVFCCSIAHAHFARDWLAERGVEVRVVHSQAGSDDRDQAIADLEAGTVQAVCSVDIFNEGLDVPRVERVVMLRPTESPVVFMQQLGRGLRAADGKTALTVIDFVGNHRIFVDRVRRLLSLGVDARPSLSHFLESEGPFELPSGCSVDVELEAKDLLQRLLPRGGTEVERVYDEIYAARDERPTAGELQRLGYLPRTLRTKHGSWFEFVRERGHLSQGELTALDASSRWFSTLEKTAMTKCFKMVVLEVLLEHEALGEGMALSALAEACHAYLRRAPSLFMDVSADDFAELEDDKRAAWRAYWMKNPIKAWTGGKQPFFAVDGDRLVPRIPGVSSDALETMTRELVDYRLAQYRARRPESREARTFRCKLTWNQRDPFIKLPSRKKHTWLPEGWTDVRLPDGSMWSFNFVKIACNKAVAAGRRDNGLPDLLRDWFGPNAGHPGTSFQVDFVRKPDGWWIEPVQAEVFELPRRSVVAYPSLRAAAGAAEGRTEDFERSFVALPVEPATGRFAVRASGDSMDGGKRPIRDGDWMVMRFARSRPAPAMEGRVALVEAYDGAGSAFVVKRLVREAGRWRLRSDNPSYPDMEPPEDGEAIAVLEETVRPESIAPPVGEVLSLEDASDHLGLGEPIRDGRGGRVGGHLFLVVDDEGVFTAPDRVARVVADRRPGETAYVFATAGGGYRYCGVGRWLDDEGAWTIPDLDFATWRALGSGRGASRRIDPRWLEGAKVVAGSVGDGWHEQDGRRFRVLGWSAQGGLRIDGGEDGFAERTVSLLDIAWVLAAAEDVRVNGGLLDEARVNKLRYLDGTPKGSTRWIDTGWASRLVAAARRLQ